MLNNLLDCDWAFAINVDVNKSGVDQAVSEDVEHVHIFMCKDKVGMAMSC